MARSWFFAAALATASSGRLAHAQSCDAASMQYRALGVQQSCCPGGGHRRTQAGGDCPLPATCPNAACAFIFTSFVDDCQGGDMEPTEWRPLYDSCRELESGAQVAIADAASVQSPAGCDNWLDAHGQFATWSQAQDLCGGFGKQLCAFDTICPDGRQNPP